MRYSPLALLVACSLSAGMAHAADSSTKITFEGTVTDQTCWVAIDGNPQGDVTVPLSPVHLGLLDVKGKTAGMKTFALSITGCKSKGLLKGVKISFKPEQVDAEGNLSNIDTSADGAEGVAVELLDFDNGKGKIDPNTWGGKELLLPGDGTGASEYNFAAQYIRTGDTIKAGKVKATVTAEMDYQ